MWYDSPREVRHNGVGLFLDFGSTTLEHTEARGLHAMWDALRGERPVPFRAELDAHRIGAKAPVLAILEHVGPSNYRIRIAGDRLNKWFGLELRGMSALSLLDTDARNHFQATLNRVTTAPAVAALHGVARGPETPEARFEMVLLPMRSDFGRVDRVLVGLWLLDVPALTRGPLRLEPDDFTTAVIEGGGMPSAEPEDAAEALAEPPAQPIADTVLRSIEGTGEAVADEAATGLRGRRRGHLRIIK